MNRAILLFLLLAMVTGMFFHLPQNKDSRWSPVPGNGTMVKSNMEEEQQGNRREAWILSLHRAAPETDWQAIEYATSMERQKAKRMISQDERNDLGEEIFANGKLKGEWVERGSKNQAGSVFDIEYDAETNQIYLVSAGGSLFKADFDFQYWEVVNDRFRFSPGLLKIIQSETGDKRMLALIQNKPHYSDDLGLTWQAADAYEADGWAHVKDAYVTEFDGKPLVFILMKTSYWNDFHLYISRDYGVSYQSIRTFYTSDGNNLAMTQIKQSGDIFVIEQIDEKETRLFRYDPMLQNLRLIRSKSPVGFGENGNGNLAGAVTVANELTLMAYDGENVLYSSIDTGQTWQFKSVLPITPWDVRLFISAENPDFMLIGAVECYRSLNGGKSWVLINSWSEYYGDVNRKLHADIMHFNEFRDSYGDPFITISNHGGLSISYDYTIQNTNIGLYDLNVCQYYSVRTSPKNENFVMAGSQDQGLQRGLIHGNNTANLDQVISGDYGHNVFTMGGERFWTVYPGGWVSHYSFPELGYLDASWELKAQNETVWIPPIIAGPDPEKDEVVMAGGAVDGGTGSYLIRLLFQNGQLSIEQLPFDFFQASSSEISAIAISPLNPQRWYVATNNGQFYYSNDSGQSFARGTINVPGSHYLYGACILPSAIDPETVYVSGSGYSTDPVLKSMDGGQHFESMSNGLPSTLAFALATNEEESLIFAATEAGPWVYLEEENHWYDLAGATAPTQSYWSVEYLKEKQTARFGTYGRGIWDFNVSETGTANSHLTKSSLELNLYPNPATHKLFIDLEALGENGPIFVEVLDQSGRQHFSTRVNNYQKDCSIEVDQLLPGSYVIIVQNDKKQMAGRFIKK